MYYFSRNLDTADTGLPMGYESGLVDDFNPAPKGSQVFENESELQKAVDKAEADDLKKIDPKSCPVILPQGTRWYDTPVVYYHFSRTISRENRDWMMAEWIRWRDFVHESCAQKIDVTNNVNRAHIKNMRIGELDGKGGTLGQVESRFIPQLEGNRLVSATLICDEADQGAGKIVTKRHEYAHTLGVGHHDDPRSLMYWASDGSEKDYDEFLAEELRLRYPIGLV